MTQLPLTIRDSAPSRARREQASHAPTRTLCSIKYIRVYDTHCARMALRANLGRALRRLGRLELAWVELEYELGLAEKTRGQQHAND